MLVADACLPGKMHFGKRVFGIAVSLCRGFFKQCLRLRQILLDQFSFKIDLAQKILCAVVVLLLGLPCTLQAISSFCSTSVPARYSFPSRYCAYS